MFSTRKVAFTLSALMVAGFGLCGCNETNWECPECAQTVPTDPQNPNNPTTSNYKGISSYKDFKDVGSECKQDGCLNNSACSEGKNYYACICHMSGKKDSIDDGDTCHTFSACHGVGDCNFKCGAAEGTCSYTYCLGNEACKSACDPNTLDETGDADGDGIPNGVEKAGKISDPCKEDTDGDGVPDGMEDINHNGKYEPLAGESNPSDPADKVDPTTSQYKVMKVTCDADKILNSNNMTYKDRNATYKEMRIAKLDSADYTKDNDSNTVATFDDSKHAVYGLFGSGLTLNGQQLLSAAKLKEGSFIEESNFNQPNLAGWETNGVYKKELQIVPEQSVTRYKYAITMDDSDTLEGIRDKIANVFQPGFAAAGGSTKCTGGSPDDKNKAILYLARSMYKDSSGKTTIRLYSLGLTCASTKTEAANASSATTAVEAMNELEDVLSGTLITPLKNVHDEAPAGGYLAFKNFVCQAEEFGSATGSVDFIWVIDNSGSMADELDKVVGTVETFATSLEGSGIDYRVAVTTTDSYLMDEWNEAYSGQGGMRYTPYTSTMQPNTQNAYMNALGIRTSVSNYQGFVDKKGVISTSATSVSTFVSNVSLDSECDTNGVKGKNICGKGYEDGFKSGAFTLSRLAINIDGGEQPVLPEADAANIETLVQLKQKIACPKSNSCSNEANKTKNYKTVSLRSDALKYIIWVSDEESRQFKEKQATSQSASNLVGCLTGYKLENGKMISGSWQDSYTAATHCNPELYTKLEALENEVDSAASSVGATAYKMRADLSLEEIQALYPDYYNMLMYYIGQYRNYKGTGDIAGFALVGDIGNKKGGYCKTLKLCDGTCILNADGDKTNDTSLDIYKKPTATGNGGFVGCFDCEGEWVDSASATIGANYGLSYIHLARFLSAITDDGKNDGKEGGFASVCNDSFQTSVEAIFEDVAGRVGSHPLKGYPIASTISVSISTGDSVIELVRGASKNGWKYNASENSIVFSGLPKMNAKDYIAISYVIWDEFAG